MFLTNIDMEQLKESQEVIHYQGAALAAKREARIMNAYM